MKLSVKWLFFLGLLLLLAACRQAAGRPPTATPTPTEELVPAGDAQATTHANAASTSCDNPVPADRQFPLPPWPNTNFCRHSVPYEEIRFGGIHRDRIPAIDNPVFHDVPEAMTWLADVEPVMALQVDGEARAYPVNYMIGPYNEVVNDDLGGTAIAPSW